MVLTPRVPQVKSYFDWVKRSRVAKQDALALEAEAKAQAVASFSQGSGVQLAHAQR